MSPKKRSKRQQFALQEKWNRLLDSCIKAHQHNPLLVGAKINAQDRAEPVFLMTPLDRAPKHTASL